MNHGVKWIEQVAERSDEISVNPMNIQRGTIIDRLHRNNEYRPPWLWSLVEMIRRAHPTIHPKGGGDYFLRLPAHDGLCNGTVVLLNSFAIRVSLRNQ